MALMDRVRLGEGKLLKQLANIAKQVNAIEDDFVAMSDEELRGQTGDFGRASRRRDARAAAGDLRDGTRQAAGSSTSGTDVQVSGGTAPTKHR